MKFFLFLIFISGFTNAQIFSQDYADCQIDAYFEQLGINISSTENGNYLNAKLLLDQTYFNNNPKAKLFIECILDYNTKGKIYTYEKINNLQLSQEEKDFLKLWLSYYTNNTDDFEFLHNEFSITYPNNISLKKIEFRKEISTYVLYNEEDRIKQKNLINEVLQTELPTSDRVYFLLLNIDFYGIIKDDNFVEPDNNRFKDFLKVWNDYKDQIHYKGIDRIIENCSENCENILNWVEINSSTKPEIFNDFRDYLKVYKDYPPKEIYINSDSLLQYLEKNPLFLEDQMNYKLNKESFTEINSNEKLNDLNTKIEKLISKYPGSIELS